MNKKKYGFAIIGTGSIAEIHALAIKDITNATLVGVYNRTYSKALSFAEEHNCKVYSSLDELATDNAIDIVCICTASGAHLEPAILCLQNKKHCLIEKPLEINIHRSDQIINAAQENKCKLGVIFPSRFYEDSKLIKSTLEQNKIGQPVLASAYIKWHRSKEYYDSGDWRGTWELDGGGCLMNQGIHTVDLLQWFMGPIESVQALTSNRLHKNIEVEDTLVAIVKYKSGAIGTIEATTAAYPGDFRKIEILGSEGSITLEDNKISNWKFKAEELGKPSADSSISNTKGGFDDPMNISYYGHKLQFIDFIDSIKNDTSPAIDGLEGLESIKIIESIYKSAQTSSKVYL